MKKTYSFNECYQALNIKPGCDWKELRRAYKTSIQKWHPDRFKDSTDEKSAAENKIKLINIAYTQIHQYYRKNEALPPVEQPSVTKQTPPQKKSTQTKPAVQTPIQRRPNNTAKKATKFPLLTSIIVITISASTYHLLTENTDLSALPPINTYTKSFESFVNDVPAKKEISTQTAAIPLTTTYFTIGSSISDVISAQGAPTRTDGDVWFYGESEVHFQDGEVTRWIRNNNNPLKAQLQINTKP